MADQAIPAVTTTESSLPACTTPLDSLMSLPERAVPVLSKACQAVRANEEARLAALNLGQVSSGTIPAETELNVDFFDVNGHFILTGFYNFDNLEYFTGSMRFGDYGPAK